MVEDKLGKLIEALSRKTESGSIEWESTSRQDTFLATLGRTSVSIQHEVETQYGQGFYLVNILDEEGNTVESTTVLFANQLWGSVVGLHNAARRQAYDVEGRLDDLLEALGEIP